MDWDLEAIVRGCCNNDGSSSIIDRFDNTPFGGLSSFGFHQDHAFLNFPDICETTTILDELEQLYKPFYPAAHTILTSTTSISVPTAEVTKVRKPPKQQQPPLLPPPPPLSGNSTDHGGGDDADRVAKLKKGRKNQQKKVVQQATADDLSSDTWAWRKYGQKPIKGSPYPRSYYRCSSSKGCPARKQVERSGSDQGLFIISYGGEHNHTHPTRRSSLAGSTRNRSSVITRRSVTNESTEQTVLSPIESPPQVTSTRDELAKGEENENPLMPDLIFNDEYFPSLEDLEGSLLYQFSDDFPEKSWFINESATLDRS